MEMLTAPVARFATMKTGNMLQLTAARMHDLGGDELVFMRKRGSESRGNHGQYGPN